MECTRHWHWWRAEHDLNTLTLARRVRSRIFGHNNHFPASCPCNTCLLTRKCINYWFNQYHLCENHFRFLRNAPGWATNNVSARRSNKIILVHIAKIRFSYVFNKMLNIKNILFLMWHYYNSGTSKGGVIQGHGTRNKVDDRRDDVMPRWNFLRILIENLELVKFF